MFLLLSSISSLCIVFFFRYHARDASVILQEQASQELQETLEPQEEYEYEYDTRQCRPCGEERQGQNPRFFLGTNQVEDMNDVPCCNLDKDDYTGEEESSDVIQLGLRFCFKIINFRFPASFSQNAECD